MQNANSHKKMYKSGKNRVAAMVATVAVAMVPMTMTTSASADDSAQPTSSWRAKTVEDVQTAVQAAGDTYVVQAGDTLSTIASATAPVAEVAPVEEAVVEQAPVVEEAAVEAPVAEAPVVNAPSAPSYNTDMTAVPGNSYYAGQCTWYVKNTLSWVGNYWGNANQWAASAAAAGRLVDTNPTVGSVAVFMPGVAGASSYGHVAVVTGVNGGMVTISEMNAQGEYVISSRTVSAAGVLFIH